MTTSANALTAPSNWVVVFIGLVLCVCPA